MKKRILSGVFLCLVLLCAQGPVNRSAGGCVAASASGTTYACSFTVDPGTYVTHQVYYVTADVANTGAVTWNINAHGAKSVVKNVGGAATALVANDIRANAELVLIYDGTNLQCASGCNGNSGSWQPTPTTTLYRYDDFEIGVAGSNTIGAFRWAQSAGGGGTGAYIVPIAGRPGIYQLDTTTGSSGNVHIYSPGAAQRGFLASENFDTSWDVRVDQDDANTIFRFGMDCGSTTASTALPTDGFVFEATNANANWQAYVRSGSAGAAIDSGVAVGTSWPSAGTRFRIRRIDSTHIGFTAPGGSEISSTNTEPTTACILWIALYNNASTTDEKAEIDRVELTINSVNR